MRVMGRAGRERVAVAVVLAATLAGGGVAVAGEGGTGSGLGRIAYADGVLTLDASEAAEAPVIEIPDARLGTAPAPGWDTTGVPAGIVDQDTLRWSLTGLDGPGDLRVYAADGEGEEGAPLFDSADGLPDGYELPAGQQGSTRWDFTAQGTYRAIFTAEARTVDGQELSVGTVYTVLVGDETIARAAETEKTEEEPGGASDEPGATEPGAEPTQPTHEARNLIAAAGKAPASAAGSAPATARTAADADVVSTPVVIDEGHIDIAARVVDEKMQIHVKDGTVSGETTWREPSSVVLHVRPAAKNTLPDGDEFAFLGKAGDPVWLLDQVQQDGLLWPGWSTDNIEAGATKGGVKFSLDDVKGPGTVALYTYDAMSGATVLFNSKDGVPDSFDIPANTHAHGGWAFTKEGTYRLTFTMSGTLADGTAVSDTETVAFVVGDENPNAVEPGDGSGNGSSSGTGGTTGTAGDGPSGTSGDDASPAGGSSGSEGSKASDGSMASTGAGNAVLLGGTAAALAALGTAFVAVTRGRRNGAAGRASA
ncbi:MULTISPECIES: TIGR03773 family transporter-associated surface protein [unclassified Streptomyces]|uniref:TIGR03773 family transporter-associated surface protein n=1 Tax=unclassified Streptomyces TaxID=2593676 RepID=UPI001488E7AE|nr:MULTISPECIES: TIGR03773 family transporter-associated surface protein [unclassified Streptomyces]